MTATSTYAVTGMSCQHCVDAVTAEIGRIAGVEQVQVDLAAGEVTVLSTEVPSIEQIRAALDEAGYDLAQPVG